MWLGLLSLFTGQLFGSSVVPIGTKISLNYITPVFFVFFRFLTATIIFLLLYILSKKRNLRKQDFKNFVLLGFCLFVNVELFTIAIQYTTILMSNLLYSATPIVVGFIAHLFLGERLTKEKITGLIIAFTGLLFLFSQSILRNIHLTFGTPLGNILIFIGMIFYSCYIFYSRKILSIKSNSVTQTTFFTFLFVTLFLFIVAFAGTIIHAVPITKFNFNGSIGILIVSVGSIFQYLLMQIGIKRTSAFITSLFHYFAPFIGTVASIFTLHERITITFVLGGLLILAGVFYATTYPYLKINKT